MLKRLLIANRGEVAIRIARAAKELGIEAVGVYPEDDKAALHTRMVDRACRLEGKGVPAYLDQAQLIEVALREGCDAVHPGYGFLSENAEFAARCETASLCFVGPSPQTLETLGNKSGALELARKCAVPTIPGTPGSVTLEEAHQFLDGLGENAAVMVKAVSGGGGRGMRIVLDKAQLDEAFAQCAAEAKAAFGNEALYVEQLILEARHIEVQVLGDKSGNVLHLGERECSLQRRNQKLVEIAPSPSLSENLREQLIRDAMLMACEVKYRSLATFEFLVDEKTGKYFFIEANPRLQVEHTVTEAVTGIDLVKSQLKIACGESLEEAGLDQVSVRQPEGFAIQARVNMETMDAEGHAGMASGVIEAYEPPSGPAVRVDGFGYRGYRVSPHYDSLLAKVIVHTKTGNYRRAVEAVYRALCQFRIEGVATNIGFLQNLLTLPEVKENAVHTRFVDARLSDLVAARSDHPRLYFAGEVAEKGVGEEELHGPPGTVPVRAPMTGVLVAMQVEAGDAVQKGAPVALLEAMKMQHVVPAHTSGFIRLHAESGEVVDEGAPVAFIEPAMIAGGEAAEVEEVDLDAIRPDLAEVIERHAIGLDEERPAAVDKRHSRGKRTARENIADLCDADSFVEYGALAVAAQRSRHPEEKLREISPADGLVAGLGSINGEDYPGEAVRCAVMAYDYTVFAGTQGNIGHRKTDRLLRVAERSRLPVVIYAEGGGGRPGDTDNRPGVNLANPTFFQLARLSGMVPLIGIASGRCFAGNAAVLGCCDVVIATRDATLGMGGPAMIEGAGLGAVAPEDVGPLSVQGPNGVVDIVAEDEAEATRLAKQYLSYFQGPSSDWQAADQRQLRNAIPENRMRAYDIRPLIEILADEGSVLELRREFGAALITAFLRIEGQPYGVIANVAAQNGGAIDRDEADKAARFMQLCDAFDLPILSLCDTPGFMVGPDAETRANVRHFSRLFLAGASLNTPFFTVILRKAYGLGAMAMSGGSFHETSEMTLSWPTGEFGAMGLEGAVRLGYRKELEAIEDPEARQERYEALVAELYEAGKAVNIAPYLSVDDVIDPAETRRLIASAYRTLPRVHQPKNTKRPMVDAW